MLRRRDQTMQGGAQSLIDYWEDLFRGGTEAVSRIAVVKA